MRGNRLLAVTVVPVLLYLAVMLAIAVFVVEPSTLGWIGLGIVAMVALGIGVSAAALYPRTLLNASRRHPQPGSPSHLLVVADTHCDGGSLRAVVSRTVRSRDAEILVVAPVLASLLHSLTDAEQDEREDAQRRLAETVTGLRTLGFSVRGMLGADDPLQAIGDALAGFPAERILLAASPPGQRSWLERGLERASRDAFGVPVSTVTIAARAHREAAVASGRR